MPYGSVPTQRHRLESRIVRRAWGDPTYRDRLIADPRAAVEEELGIQLPDGMQVSVVEERPDHVCIVLPVDSSGITPITTRVMLGLRPPAPPA